MNVMSWNKQCVGVLCVDLNYGVELEDLYVMK